MKKNINIHNFANEGLVNFGSIIDQKKCKKLRNQINSVRPCNKKIFFSSYSEFKKGEGLKKYSPGGSFNALTSLNFDLDFIEKSESFTKAVESIMGKNFKILKKNNHKISSKKFYA